MNKKDGEQVRQVMGDGEVVEKPYLQELHVWVVEVLDYWVQVSQFYRLVFTHFPES